MRTTTALALVLALAASAASRPPTPRPARPSACSTRAGPTSTRPTRSPASSSRRSATTRTSAPSRSPVGFEGMKAGDIDVFLGNWMPAHAEFRADLDAAKAVEVLAQNLDRRQVHPRRPVLRRHRRLRRARPERRAVRLEDLRHRPGHRRQQDHPGDDRERRLRPRRLGARRDQRAGDARPGRARREVRGRRSSSSPGRRTR